MSEPTREQAHEAIKLVRDIIRQLANQISLTKNARQKEFLANEVRFYSDYLRSWQEVYDGVRTYEGVANDARKRRGTERAVIQ